MKKIFTLAFALTVMVLANANTALAQKEWLFIDSIHYVSSTQIQFCYHTNLDDTDEVTNIVILAAELPAKTPLTKILNQPIPGTGEFYATELVGDLSLHKSYAVCIYATALRNPKEYKPWDADMTVTIPAVSTTEVRNIATVSNTVSITTVYPNPSNGNFVISNADYKNATYELFDANGRKVRSMQATGKETHVTSDLAKGNYFLRAGGAVQKVTIQ